MGKRLVLCCDGTWNRPDQRSAGEPAPTNVVKVALAVAPFDDAGRQQRTFYQRGVGTEAGERIRGGLFGFGLSRNVKETYRFLVQNFEPDDEVFLFGFSRGAYTARSTAGFIRNCGILRPEYSDRIDEAYRLYRSRNDQTHPRSIEAQLFRRSFSHTTPIRFVGVWDTVGALGVPLSSGRLGKLVNRPWQFHDTELSSQVEAAFQALAIDEQRGPFRPAVWKPSEGTRGQRLEQAWFSGVHSDVGGGYPETSLSDIALRWMVDRARSCGLGFLPDAFRSLGPEGDGTIAAPDPLHQSRKGFYRLLRPFSRPIGAVDPDHESVSATAIERHRIDPGYAPENLVTYLRRQPAPSTTTDSAVARAS